MGLPVSLFLIAIGAILVWAVEASPSGLNIDAIGVILLVVGLVGMLLSLAFWSSWAGPGYFTGRRRTVAYDEPVAPRRRTIVEDDVDVV